MTPSRYQVASSRRESRDVVTLDLTPRDEPLAPWQPGQFMMIYAFGIGEVPISISGGHGHRIRHTVRAVGAVTAAICAAAPGAELGLRGPFGQGWALPENGDLVVVAGGIGVAPLRPLVLAALAARERFGTVEVFIGARAPADLIFAGEYAAWRARGADVQVTVDQAAAGWTGHVGVVTALFGDAMRRGATAYLCGPEIMMRYAARDLADRGTAPGRIQLSLERNMRCGYGVCGHCQLGEMIICRDGPVARYGQAAVLMGVREL